MSIPQKGWILVAIPLMAQLAFLGVLALSREHQQHTREMAIHTHEVLVQAEACHRQVIEAQSHAGGYLLTQDAAYLQSFEKSRVRIPDEFSRLARLVGDHPDQQRKVNVMKALAGAFVDWTTENVRLAQQGKREEVVRRIQPAASGTHLQELRDKMTAFLVEEHQLDDERVANHERAVRLQTNILLAGVVLALASSFALLVGFSRSISRRVATLIDNTRRFAEGKELAAPLDGKDELRRIDDVFREMASAIRQKEQENEMFVYSVSHDLRSPLVNLQGFSQELAIAVGDLRALVQKSTLPEQTKARASKLIDRDAAEAISFIQSAVTRLSGIIDALLRLSRIGRVEFRLQDIDVNAIAHRVIDALKNSLTKRDAAIHVGPLPTCWSDPRAVDHVFANLIGNAVNYLDPARPGKIEVGVLEEGLLPGYHVYYVKDNGLGIPEPMQPKVFVAFQRLHPEAAPGEGVGLAQVRRVVERLGGRVWLESHEGVGSTFYVALPVSREARPSSVLLPPEPTPAPTPPPRPTIDSSSEWQVISPGNKVNA